MATQVGATTTDGDPLVEALSLLVGDPAGARRQVEVLAAGGDELAAAIARHLAGGPHDGVYVDPEGFQRFISGGGNVPLYVATSATLARHHPAGSGRVLDIGAGDGRAVIPAAAAHDGHLQIDAVEPAEVLRDALRQAVADSPHDWTVHHQPLEEFAEGPLAHWDVAEATFALHNLTPDRLRACLSRLRPHVERLVIVEFDVPAFDDQRDPARLAYLVDRYRDGIAEYPGDDTVVQGFLVPVLLGGIDAATEQTTWERPASAWVDDVRSAGFGQVEVEPVSPYWWGPAVAIVAR